MPEPTNKNPKYVEPSQTGDVLTPKGMGLVCEYFDQKEGKPCDIFVVEGEDELKTTLEKMPDLPNGSKFALVVLSGGHWNAVLCERKNNQNYIAVMDSLGFSTVGGGHLDVQNVIANSNKLKNSTKLFKNVHGIQFDLSNCGSFSIRFCRKMLQKEDFFGSLEREGFVLKSDELAQFNLLESKRAKVEKPKRMLEQQAAREYNQNIVSYVMPPDFYSLIQRGKYIKFYKEQFGHIEGIAKFTHKTKSGQQLTIEEMVARQDRQVKLSPQEQDALTHIGATNNNVIYFRNKYISKAMGDMIQEHDPAEVEQLFNRHFAKNISTNQLAQTANRNEKRTSNKLEAKADEVVVTNVVLAPQEKEQVVASQVNHYAQVVLEERQQQHLVKTRSEKLPEDIDPKKVDDVRRADEAKRADVELKSPPSLESTQRKSFIVKHEPKKDLPQPKQSIPAVATIPAPTSPTPFAELTPIQISQINSVLKKYGNNINDIIERLNQIYLEKRTEKSGVKGLLQRINIGIGNVYKDKRELQLVELAQTLAGLQKESSLNSHEKAVVLYGALQSIRDDIKSEKNVFKSRLSTMCKEMQSSLKEPQGESKFLQDPKMTKALYQAYKDNGASKFREMANEKIHSSVKPKTT